MPSMKQQREINDLRDRVESLDARVESLEKILTQPKKEAAKKPANKRAKNGSV